MIEVRDIGCSYGSAAVLAEVSFTVDGGEVLAVIGANGAGKTTLIKVLNGTVEASGLVEIENNPLSTLSRREVANRIAVVSQENETRFPITVLEFVLAGRFASGGAFGWESKTDIAAASEAIRDCDLAGYESRFMNELSGGERQRVVLARAIATDAKILLLDEPTANLDLAHQASMFRLIKERCAKDGYSAVVIAHDLNLVAQFADKVLILKDGRVLAHGAPEDVLTEQNVREAFNVEVMLDLNPSSGGLRVTHIFN